MSGISSRTRAVSVAAVVAVVAVLASTSGSATASTKTPKLTPGIAVTKHKVSRAAAAGGAGPRALARKPIAGEPGTSLPAGVPTHGRYSFLLKLDARGTGGVYKTSLKGGRSAAHAAAKNQLNAVTAAQNRVIKAMPSGSKVLYRAHAALAAVAINTDVKNYAALTRLPGVAAVYPVAPKSKTNSYAVPLQGAPAAWVAHGDLGQDSTVAVIDTGLDYTHADFGGAGTTAAYNSAKAAEGASPDFPSAKVLGGYDLVGDDYNADPLAANYQPVPSPDPYPLDCDSHGTHVSGTVAGLGVKSNGATYTGPYDNTTPFSSLRIGPGMAPAAKLYAYRVIGCEGSTDIVAAAIDMAADPNGDGDPMDHVDVINMSLGADYGSPQDGDAVAANDAAALGISVVISAGNAGDIYDVVGSPGTAPRAITVAASKDAFSQVDALNVSAPASIADGYPAERSIAYDWVNDDDLAGTVAQVTDPENLDGCDPLNDTDAAAVNHKIAFVEWTDNDANRRCGSAGRAANLVAAGAIGFIYADDEEHFAAGITGSEVIPGVLAAKSGADLIRTKLEADEVVTISSTSQNGYPQNDPTENDGIAGFTSRGSGDAGNLKPDITAVGESVFSASSGTGNLGQNDSGTSMAAPMTAGAAALVRSEHPDWTPEQVKADLMNTAGQDLFTGSDHTGDKYAPQRVGTGRLQVDRALDNDVLAYVVDDPGAVGVSFGPQALTAPTVLHKVVRVQNTGLTSVSFGTSYLARTTTPGANYSVSPAVIDIDPESSAEVTVTLTLNPAQMTKTHDVTVAELQAGLPRQFQADASGLLMLDRAGSSLDLRVPVFSAPRPASNMTQPATVTLPKGGIQEALLPLTGQQVNQGSGSTKVVSTIAGLELQAVSDPAPDCADEPDGGCVNFPDERSADFKRFGATSNAPQLVANGENALENGLAYFAINTQQAWRTAASSQEFDIYIDGDGDGVADVVAYNTRLPDTDVLVAELVDLNTGHVLDDELINDSFGDTDTAVFESDTMVMPVAIGAIPGVSQNHSRIHYSVFGYTALQADPVDHLGDVDEDLNLVDPLSLDVLKPGIALYGSYNGDASPFLFPDGPGSVLKLRRDAAAYNKDGGLGAMVVHFHNKLGFKTQVVALKKVASTLKLTVFPNPVRYNTVVTAKVVIAEKAGVPPIGTVTLRRANGTPLGSAALVDGVAVIKYTNKLQGDYTVHASYPGDTNYSAGFSNVVKIRYQRTVVIAAAG